MSIHSTITASDSLAFVCGASLIAKALLSLKPAVMVRQTIDSLNFIRATSDGEGLRLTANNLDLELSQYIPLEGIPAFDLCVRYKTFYDLCRAKAKALAVFDVSDGLTVDGLALETISPGEFPGLPIGENLAQIAIAGSAFAPCVKAISKEATRYYLNGAFIHGEARDGGAPVLNIVATDGHRMAIHETGLAWPEGGDAEGMILPDAFVQSIADKGEGLLTLCETGAVFTYEGFTASTKVIDGRFPDYRRVTPTHIQTRALINKADLVTGLKTLSALEPAKTKGARFRFEGQTLTMTGRGDFKIANVAHYEDAPVIGFNMKYVADICADMRGDTVEMCMNHSDSPVLIRDGAVTFVLMPLRV